jgi:hypothetical protein
VTPPVSSIRSPASQHAASAILHPEPGVAHTFRARLSDEILPELVYGARLKAGFFRPAFTRLLFDALETSERIRRVMADLVAGEQSYRTLARRLLATGELGLAWRLARLKLGLAREPVIASASAYLRPDGP